MIFIFFLGFICNCLSYFITVRSLWHCRICWLYFLLSSTVESFLDMACSVAVVGGSTNKEYALHILHRCKGNIKVCFVLLAVFVKYFDLALCTDHEWHFDCSARWNLKMHGIQDGVSSPSSSFKTTELSLISRSQPPNLILYCNLKFTTNLKPWPNGLASRLASSRKSQKAVHFILAINLCWLALGGQTVKNVHRLAYEFELDQSQHKLSQVITSQCKWMAKQNATWTQVENLCWLASSFGQGFKLVHLK